MARKLILTVDYEIFGNGSGDVRQHVVDPTERMARICEKYGFPLTIFFEMEEYLAFKRNREELNRHLSYDPADLISDQVRELASRGHDFQLHLHPQWHEASFHSGQWKLRTENETVDSLFENKETVSKFIAARKGELEKLVERTGTGLQGEAACGQPVIAYRAGAFSARPGEKLLPALEENGFRFESSVVRGLFREAAHYCLDYRNVDPPNPMWLVTNDVAREDTGGSIWEMPIYSVKRRRFRQLTPSRLKAKFSRNVPREQQKAMVGRFAQPSRPLAMLESLLEPVPIKLDYHNLSPTELMKMIKTAPVPCDPREPDVLVLIGHTKEHIDDAAFDRFISAVAADPNLEVVTFHKIASELDERHKLRGQQQQKEAATADSI